MAFAYYAETDAGEIVFTGRNLNFLMRHGHKASNKNWISQVSRIEVEKFSSSAEADYEIDEYSKMIKDAQFVSNATWGLPASHRTSCSDVSNLLLFPQEPVAPGDQLKGRTSLYEYFDQNDQLIYCGISANPFRRWTQHLRSKSWAAEVVWISITWCDSRDIALTLEHATIVRQRPTYNLNNGELVFETLPEHLRPEVRQLRKSLGALLHNCDLADVPAPFGINPQAPLSDIISALKSDFGSIIEAGQAVWDVVNKQSRADDPYPFNQASNFAIAA